MIKWSTSATCTLTGGSPIFAPAGWTREVAPPGQGRVVNFHFQVCLRRSVDGLVLTTNGHRVYLFRSTYTTICIYIYNYINIVHLYTTFGARPAKNPIFGCLRLCHGYFLRSPWHWLRPGAPLAMDGSRHGTSGHKNGPCVTHFLPERSWK